MSGLRTHCGFTLLELLAAVALLVLLGALLFQIFGQASTVTRIGSGRQEVFEYARALFETLQKELDGIIGIREAGPEATGSPLRIGTSSSGLAGFKGEFGVDVREGSDVLAFTSALVGRDTQQGSPTRGEVANVAKVAYWVTPDDSVLNRYESYKRVKPGGGRGWEFALNVLEFRIGVLHPVTGGMAFERKDWNSDAVASGPSTRSGLPRAIRVTVKLTDSNHIMLYAFDPTTKSMVPKPGVRASDDPVVQEFGHVVSFPEHQ